MLTALECPEGFFACVAFGLAAQVVGTSGGVVADLGDCDHVDRVVQLSVAARVQAVALVVTAGRLDRCCPVVARELCSSAEPRDVVDMAEHRRSDDRTDTMEFGQRCPGRNHGIDFTHDITRHDRSLGRLQRVPRQCH